MLISQMSNLNIDSMGEMVHFEVSELNHFSNPNENAGTIGMTKSSIRFLNL